MKKEGMSDAQTAASRVMAAKTHYEIFGLQGLVFDETKVRKEYRKLAIKLHPDKTSEPSAKEAFHRVSEALQCLSDAVSRARYDLTLARGKTSKVASSSKTRSQPTASQPPRGAPPLGKTIFHMECINISCKYKMQAHLQNHYGPEAQSVQVRCPKSSLPRWNPHDARRPRGLD